METGYLVLLLLFIILEAASAHFGSSETPSDL